MAIFKWVGNTGTSQTKFDWNTPSNWRIRSLLPTGVCYAVTSFSPGPFDEVWIGAVSLEPGINDDRRSPKALSPLLYGGFSGTVAGGSWANAQLHSGNTFTSALSNLFIDIRKLRGVQEGQTYITEQYEFPYIGGGLGNPGSLRREWINENSPVDSIDTTDPRTSQLTVKVNNTACTVKDDNIGFILSRNSDVEVALTYVKNFSQVGGGTASYGGVTAGLTAAIVKDVLSIVSNGIVDITNGVFDKITAKGYKTWDWYEVPGSGTVWFRNVVFNQAFINHQLYTQFNGGTGNHIRIVNNIQPNDYWINNAALLYSGNLNSDYVLSELYNGIGGITGALSVNDNTILMDPVSLPFGYTAGVDSNIPDGAQFPVYLGDFSDFPQRKFFGRLEANSNNAPNTGMYRISFIGPVDINTISINRHRIMSTMYKNYASNSVRIGTVYLDVGSILDFAANPVFDQWYFGLQSAAGISGGIVFLDEESIIRGSAGLRLWNTNLQVGGRVDTRTGVISASTKTPLPSAPASVD